jgi:sarcosine oxidase, subunit alpha
MAPRRIDPRSVRAVTNDPAAEVLRALYAYAPPDAGAPCTIEHDGRSIAAREGEPVAISLLAAGVDTLSRSVKFHRPRGPMCMRGNCEGCLVRLDGEPNRMACTAPSRDGREVRSQNSFPSAQIDILRVTDWFFPKQFDHHHLMVRYGTTINEVMQSFARKMAGLGTLPERPERAPAPETIDYDVLVVGLGPVGLSVATALARAGHSVCAVEEEPFVGGWMRDSLRWFDRDGKRVCGAEASDRDLAALRSAGASVRVSSSACATFDDGTIVIQSDRALWVRPRARVFTNGCHESVGAFGDNDLPGVFTARAAARALRYGVRVGESVLVCGHPEDPELDALSDALSAAGATVHRLPEGATLVEALGSSSVTGALVGKGESDSHKIKCDAIVAPTSRTPAFELAGQAGVEAAQDLDRQCFAARGDEFGRTQREDVFVAGSVAHGGRSPVRESAVVRSVTAWLAKGAGR